MKLKIMIIIQQDTDHFYILRKKEATGGSINEAFDVFWNDTRGTDFAQTKVTLLRCEL
jgi:hypothetical protein